MHIFYDSCNSQASTIDFVQCSIICRTFMDETGRGSLNPRSLSPLGGSAETHDTVTWGGVPGRDGAVLLHAFCVSACLFLSSLSLFFGFVDVPPWALRGGRSQEIAKPGVICFVILVKDRKVRTF